jgi:predicted MFS family arabinose efflux permease
MALTAAGGCVQLLRMPGVPRMAASALVLGIAGTMAPLSFVLFAHRATGSFATASIVLAASTAGGLLAAPFRGRLIDGIGPSAAILRLALPSAATDVAFILVGHARAPAGVLVAVALVAGAVIAPSTAAVRSVWSELLADSEARQAGYALIGVLQEVAFVGGPLVAGGIIALWSTTAAVAAAAGLSLVGGLAAGIGAGSLLYGLRTPARPADRRYPPLCGLAAAPRERPAEAFAWLAILYGAGSAVGAALGGQLIAASGPRAGAPRPPRRGS